MTLDRLCNGPRGPGPAVEPLLDLATFPWRVAATVEASKAKKEDQNVIELEGEVMLHARNVWKVMLSNGAEVQCTLGGKLRKNNIRVLEGDRVTVEMSPFDLTRGRITFRSIDSNLLKTAKEKADEEKERRKEREKEERRRQAAEEANAGAS
ncbi:unnamed protein product [Prorocentrum cordatum]|uniref:S1-like domain-containing protein n=1 Tax=Prorocentrum cordatum TaxID=2364126 RepID=A0ABN9U5D7_9DINO|nr:unnamed protein product [Polarella glacialis]